MDFIPLPDGVASHVPVLYLGGPDYDNQGYTGYDLRQGWNLRALRLGRLNAARTDWRSYERSWPCATLPGLGTNGSERRTVLAAAFIQTWVLFGIFHQVLRRPLMRHELCSPTPDDPLRNAMSTRSISTRSAFGEFLSGRRNWGQDRPFVLHSISCLHAAHSVVCGFRSSPAFPKESIELDSVFQALVVLIESIYSSLNIFCLTVGNPVPLNQSYSLFGTSIRKQRGWCPNLATRIGDTAALYFASLVPGLVAEQNHDQCSDDLCVASNIDKGRYTTEHVPKFCRCFAQNCDHKSNKCQCHEVAMPAVPFRAAFEAGGFPLVRLQGNAIDVVEYSPGTSFVAISHPWSDGRGNSAANSLPLCQLQAISAYVTPDRSHGKTADTETSGLFWMDTLCVPIAEPLRNTAILRMAKVYSYAIKTIVLSTDLIEVNRPSTTHETLLRISCSKWSTRLWLLHEAALANELVFQFADGTINHRILHMKTLAAGFEPVDQTFLLTLAVTNNLINGMVHIRANGICEFRSLEDLWSALQFRTSSRVSDATICGSIILGTDLEKVLAVPDDQKMETFWACQRTIPIRLLFVSGPRLKTDGFRWAPSDLLNPDAVSMPLNTIHKSDLEGQAKPTADGLLVTGTKVVLINIPEAHRFQWRGYRLSLTGSPTQHYFWIDGSSNDSWVELVKELGPQWNGHCALFLGGPENGRAAVTVPRETSRQSASASRMPDCIYTRYVLQVKIWEDDRSGIYYVPGSRRRPEDDFATEHEDELFTELGEALQAEIAQQWCVY